MKQETRHAVSGAEGTVACRDEVAVVERRKSKETTKSEQPTSSPLDRLTSRPAQLAVGSQIWPKPAKTPRFPYKNPRHGTTMTWV